MTTGGDAVSYGNGVARAPKRDLVGVAQAALQTSRLRIAADLPEAKALIQGLQNFQVKITAAANDVYGAWREGTHDDLVLAVTPALLTIVLTIMLQGYTQLYERHTKIWIEPQSAQSAQSMKNQAAALCDLRDLCG